MASDTSPDETPSCSPQALYERIDRGESVHLLDVRTRDEFESWRIDGTAVEHTHVPYSEFVAAKARDEVADLVADLGVDGPVVAVCPRGEVSATVADLLQAVGVEAQNLDHGMHGWARVYVRNEISTGERSTDGATVFQYDRPASGCLAYLVVSGDEAAVIDPLREFTDRYVADAEAAGATLKYAIDTHVHADHLSGVQALANETDAVEVANETGAEAVLPAGATDRGLAFDATLLEDGAALSVGDATVRARHAPGHTTELTALRLGDVLFSGDALFVDGFGRPDLEREDGARDLAATLYETLTDRLLALPDETLVAPGHRTLDTDARDGETYTARLADVRERLELPDDREEFVTQVLDSLPPRPANYERIIPVNLGQESVDDETAFEMELGPNNCAAESS